MHRRDSRLAQYRPYLICVKRRHKNLVWVMSFLAHGIRGSKRGGAMAWRQLGVVCQSGKDYAVAILAQAIRNPGAYEIRATVPRELTFIRIILKYQLKQLVKAICCVFGGNQILAINAVLVDLDQTPIAKWFLESPQMLYGALNGFNKHDNAYFERQREPTRLSAISGDRQ